MLVLRLSTATLLACFLLLSFFRIVVFPTEQVTHLQQPPEPPIQPPPRPQQQLPPSLPPPLPPAQNGADRVNIPLSGQSQLALGRAVVVSQRQLGGLKAMAPSTRSDTNWTLAAGLGLFGDIQSPSAKKRTAR